MSEENERKKENEKEEEKRKKEEKEKKEENKKNEEKEEKERKEQRKKKEEKGEKEKKIPCPTPINKTKSFAVFDTSRRINWKEAVKSIKNAKKVNNNKNNNAVIKNPSNSKRTSTSSLNPGKTGVNNRGENVRTKGGLPLQL